jgi:hypothetical protein
MNKLNIKKTKTEDGDISLITYWEITEVELES